MYKQEVFVPFCSAQIDIHDPIKISGVINSDEGYDIIEKWFCYNTIGKTPTINDPRIVCGDGIGSFEYSWRELPSGKYYFKAYAINQAGCGYSYSVMEITIP